MKILQHFCSSVYNLQPKFERNLNDFPILIQNWSLLSPIDAFNGVIGCYIILNNIKYLYGTFNRLNAQTYPNIKELIKLLPLNLQSTMFLVKYFDLQIYNFVKLSVYNLHGLHA